MPHEVIEYLSPKSGEWYLDATFGGGGHTALILETGARVIATDWDQAAIAAGTERFATEIASDQLRLRHAAFSELPNIQTQEKISLAGCLFDFGTSTEQLMSGERGFSFSSDGPLDMRMDKRLGVTAADLLNALPVKQLAQLFREYGGEERSGAIARAIKAELKPLTTTSELAELITRTKRGVRTHLHPATKVFQALRIAVNRELDEITEGLKAAFNWLNPQGVLVCISFHEGEDRLVKHAFRAWKAEKSAVLLTEKPLQPSEAELLANPRSRSAKLRVLRKSNSV